MDIGLMYDHLQELQDAIEQMSTKIDTLEAENKHLKFLLKNSESVIQITELEKQLRYTQELNRKLECKVMTLLKKRGAP